MILRNIKNLIFSIATVLCLVSVFSIHRAESAPNYTMNYQGKLTNASGVAVADGTYNMRFWLLTTPTIATTSAIWTESLTGTDKVQVTNGLFSVMLGSTSPLSGIDFNQTLYLGVEIGGTGAASWDGEMSPRKILGTVPSAFEAKNSATLGGVASTSFLRSDQDDSASGLLTFTGGIISNAASSTILNLSTLISTTTTLVINGDQFTDLTGSGLAISSGALTVATSTFFTTSAQFAQWLSDETGSGSVVFSASPTFTGTAIFANASSSYASTTGLTAQNAWIGNILTIGTSTNSATFMLQGSGTTNPFSIASSTGSSLFTILANGNVGIGSSTPSAQLSVMGQSVSSGNASDALRIIGGDSVNGLAGGVLIQGGVAQGFGAGGALQFLAGTSSNGRGGDITLRGGASGSDFGGSVSMISGLGILNSGDVNILVSPDASPGGGSVNITSGYGSISSGNVNINASSTGLIRLGYLAGNVAIGTTTASEKLTVHGNLRLTGALFDTTNASGTNGMVLQTTGSGVQWVATNTLGISGTADGGSHWTYDGSRLTPSSTVGIGIFASSTIGGGTDATGLTISGGATTTGNHYFGTSIGLGSDTITDLTGTGLTITSGALTVSTSTFFTTSAQFAQWLSDETGTGNVVFSAAPTFTGTTQFASLTASGSSTFAYASATALTVSGNSYFNFASSSNASTTGLTAQNAYVGGNLAIGTSTPQSTLTIRSTAGTNPLLIASSTGSTTLALLSTGDLELPGQLVSAGINWTARTAAGDDDGWNSAVYGNGLFVAVGGSGDIVMTSPDGINWTARSAAGNDDTWNSVTYGNGLFVAVGNSGDRVMTSPDGINWTARSAVGNNDSWYKVTYGNGLFVAVGQTSGDRVMTSPDGINWTARSAAGNDDDWYSISYGNGLFVAVGLFGDRVMYSGNGITWATTTAVGDDDEWTSVTYGNGLFVAVGASGDIVMTSPDGINWTARSAVGDDDVWFSVTYGGGVFVAVNGTGSGDVVMTSPDGINWTARSAVGDDDSWNFVTFGNGQFVGVGYSGDRVMTSGKTFTNALATNNIFQGGASFLGGPFNIGTTTSTTNAGIANVLNIASTTGTSLFTILANGNVGIGSTSPTRLLTVAGDAYFTNAITAASGTITYASTTGLTASNANFTNATTSSIYATTLGVGSEYFTDLTGTGLTITSGALTVSTSTFFTTSAQFAQWLSDETGTGNVVFSASPTFTGTAIFANASSTNASTTGLTAQNAYVGGFLNIGTTTSQASLTLDKLGLTGSVIGGMKEYLSFANATLDAVYYGDNAYIVNAPTATSTLIGSIIRIEDTSALGNTVRAFEAQAFRGTNTKGENTGVSGFGRTFGVRGTTIGDAGNTYLPAGVFAESQGTTQGNALRAYSGTITTEDLVSLFHDTSVFTGTGLQMNFGNANGSFAATTSAKFLDLQVAGTSKFTVSANGSTTIGDGSVKASLRVPFGGICVDNDGSCSASTTGHITSVSSATGNSDLAEIYFSSQSLHAGEIVSLAGGLSIKRADREEDDEVIGVVSTKPGLLLGFDDTSLIAGENSYPVGLKGRVPVKLSTENGPIRKGDKIALSSIPGVGMKATESSRVVGVALEDFDGERAYSEGFLNQFGDDMVQERLTPRSVETDVRTQDGCYFGGGSALGEGECVEQEVAPTATATPIEDTTRETVLRELAEQSALQTLDAEGESVTIGQTIMFIELGWYQIDREALVLKELSATTTFGQSEMTLWDRVKGLAQNFVDGVLTLTGLKADRVDVKNELCVDGVCVTADDLRALLDTVHESGDEEGGMPPPPQEEVAGDPPVEDPPPIVEESGGGEEESISTDPPEEIVEAEPITEEEPSTEEIVIEEEPAAEDPPAVEVAPEPEPEPTPEPAQ